MKKALSTIVAGVLIMPILTLGVSIFTPSMHTVSAQTITTSGIKDGADDARGDDQPAELFGDGGIFKTITNTILYVLGAISVIMLIYGGIRYTISGGDSAQVTAAKNTILYAIIGVIVALMAYAIINFVLDSLIA